MASSSQDGKSPGGLLSRLKSLAQHFVKNPRLGIPVLVLVLALLYAVVGITNNSPRIVKMEPEGEIGVKSNLTFYFSREVVSEEEVGRLTVSDKIVFHPAVPGKIRWEDTRTLRFFPEAPFLPSTRYSVKIARNLPSLKGVSLSGDRSLEFTTELFRIKRADLGLIYEAKTRKGLMLQGRLVFNHPVGLEELRRRLTLRFTDDGTAVGYTLRLENEGREAVIASELLQYGKNARRIELALPEGFCCLGGKIGLRDRFVRVLDLRERRALKVNDLETSTEGGGCSIVIHFSEPPDPAVLEDFLSIRPELDFDVSVEGEKAVLSAPDFKSGDAYEITVREGLPALNGDPLPRDFKEEIVFPDLEPSIGFNSPGRYLSSKGHLNLGLETVNVDRVELEIAKIYANNLVAFLHRIDEDGWCYSYELPALGRVVGSRTVGIQGGRNEVLTTPVNLGEFLNDERKGLFQVTARDPEARWLTAVKIAVITDLGIMAKFGADDLVVWVNSLDTLAPCPGVRVSLISYNNQEIVAGYTDENGIVTFAGIRKRLTDYRPYLILAEYGEDFSFVHLDEGRIDTTDFPVDGRPHLREGYEAYLYTDRGVFRPGDTANLAAVVRGPQAAVPPEFPLRLEIVGPDGMVFREYAGTTGTSGFAAFRLEIPDYAKTGRYSALLYAAKEVIGRTSFNVEEFIPDRIKVEVVADKDEYGPGEKASIGVRGINLFGPPAAGRRVELTARLEAMAFSPAAYRSFSFGDATLNFQPIERDLGQDELDGEGRAGFTFAFPDDLRPPGAVRVIFQATVTEEGGRAVTNYKTVVFHPYRAYLGLKTPEAEYAKPGEDYPLRLVETDREGRPVAGAEIEVTVYAVTWNSIYRRDEEGRYTYQSERQEKRLAEDRLRLANGEGTYPYRPPSWGCYKLVFADPKTGARAVREIYAYGWGYSPWAMDHPDRVQLDLDKKVYQSGETAALQIKAPFAGRALVTVERERVYDVYSVELKENTGTISIPVKESYKPNVYLSVHLIRGIRLLDKRAPARAFGTIPLAVDCGAQRLKVDIAAKEEYRPNQSVEVEVAVEGGGGGAQITLAAVDEGICQLTEFATPDPWEFFYGKRALGLDTYDLYGMLLPETAPVETGKSPAGDEGMENVRRRNLNPVAIRRVKPVSLWSGVLGLDTEGKARVRLDLPQFNGTLRLMAVAVSGERFGSAARKVLVRDPIVLTSTYPRVLAPGDRAEIAVGVFNGTGRKGGFTLELRAEGPVRISGSARKDLTLEKGEEKMVSFAVAAGEAAGACRFVLKASGNGAATTETTELAVRPAAPAVSAGFAGSVPAGRKAVLELPGGWIPGTARYSLAISPLPAMKFAGGLRYLLGYPYGCVEQTTSKVFPLLYFADLAEAADPALLAGGRAEACVRQGLEKLQSMQLQDGSFSFWPGTDYVSEWGSIYAAHFLVEARKAGYVVPDRVYDSMLGWLGTVGRRTIEGSWSRQLRVYALYVLSLAGKPQLSSMAFIKGQQLSELTPDSRAQLAAAYYYAGDRQTARELLPNTFAAYTGKREAGGNFNSAARTDAIVLSALADLDPAHPAVPKLVERLTGAIRIDAWGTTQENAFALMALGKLLRRKETGDYTGEVSCNGRVIAAFDSKGTKRLTGEELAAGRLTIAVEGAGECYYYAEAAGVPQKPPAAESHGLAVKREFFDRRGAALDPERIRQGDLVVVGLTIETRQDGVQNIALVDLLPAGLEIENPRLATSAALAWAGEKSFTPTYLDIRDDRLIVFADFDWAGVYRFYYAARAVTRGTFVLPPLRAECMYEPEVYGVSAGGKVRISD